MTTEMLGALREALNVQPRQEVNTMDFDDMCQGAERAVAVANDLHDWADASPSERTAVERFRALAVVREMANEQWSVAARTMRTRLPGSM